MEQLTMEVDLQRQFDVARADIAWLGGFWDADGSVYLTKRHTYLVPVAAACNTSKKLIDNITRILDAADLVYRVDYQDRGDRTNAAPAWHVKMEGRSRVYPFLQMIRDSLAGKQEQADLVLQWCRLPKSNGPKAPPEGYWEIKEELTILNARGRVRD
jgi:hypothetical protein